MKVNNIYLHLHVPAGRKRGRREGGGRQEGRGKELGKKREKRREREEGEMEGGRMEIL